MYSQTCPVSRFPEIVSPTSSMQELQLRHLDAALSDLLGCGDSAFQHRKKLTGKELVPDYQKSNNGLEGCCRGKVSLFPSSYSNTCWGVHNCSTVNEINRKGFLGGSSSVKMRLWFLLRRMAFLEEGADAIVSTWRKPRGFILLIECFPTQPTPPPKKKERTGYETAVLSNGVLVPGHRASQLGHLGSSLWTRKPPFQMNKMTLLLSWYSWSTRAKCKAKVLVWCRVLCPEKVPVVFPIGTRTLPLDVVSKARTDLPDFP